MDHTHTSAEIGIAELTQNPSYIFIAKTILSLNNKKKSLELTQVQTWIKWIKGAGISVFHKSVHRLLWDGARSSAVTHQLAGISKENTASKLPIGSPLAHPHLIHLDVLSYQKEAVEFLENDCFLHTRINQLRFTKKALKKCRRCPPLITSQVPFPLVTHPETWKKIFLPIVMASEEQEYCYQIWRPKPQLASLPKRTTCKILRVACVSLKDASGEKPPPAFVENHSQLLSLTGVITKDSTPEEMAEPTSSAGELFSMNSPAPIFYRHGFHLHLWNCFN